MAYGGYAEAFRSKRGQASAPAPNVYERATEQRVQTMPPPPPPTMAPAAPTQGGYGGMIAERQSPVMQSGGMAPPMQTNNIFDKIRANQAGNAGGGAPAPNGPGQHDLGGWDESDKQTWNEIAAAIRAMPDFAGKNAMYNTALSQFETLVNERRSQPKIDLSGTSEVADQYNSQRERLMNDLAASGMSGSGVQAGAMSNLAGSQARAQGSFVRDALEGRRREDRGIMQQFLQRLFGMQQQGLDRVYGKEDEPGFWGDALGVLGGVAGTALGGPVGGALGSGIGGLFGRNKQEEKPKPDYFGYGDEAAGGGWY